MKKVLEGELLSIAHRILQMKDKDDVNKLYKEAKEVYEKLLILKFYNDNKSVLQGSLSQEILEKHLELATDVDRKINLVETIESVETTSQTPIELVDVDPAISIANTKEKASIQSEKLVHIDTQKIEVEIPAIDFEKKQVDYETQFIDTDFDDSLEENEEDHFIHQYLDQHEAMLKQHESNLEDSILEIDETIQDALVNPQSAIQENRNVKYEDSFLGFNFGEVDFVRVEDTDIKAQEKVEVKIEPIEKELPEIEKEDKLPTPSLFDFEREEPVVEEKKTLNDIYNNKIVVGLNDRIGFEKHLFNGNSDDLNRVLSQLNSLYSLEEATTFMEEFVKPDYNNWEGKDDYAARFMDLIKKRFI